MYSYYPLTIKINLHFPSPNTSNGFTAAATPTKARATLPAAPRALPANPAPVVIIPRVRASPLSFSLLLPPCGAAWHKTPTKAIATRI